MSPPNGNNRGRWPDEHRGKQPTGERLVPPASSKAATEIGGADWALHRRKILCAPSNSGPSANGRFQVFRALWATARERL
jgi:hypothetical protein